MVILGRLERSVVGSNPASGTMQFSLSDIEEQKAKAFRKKHKKCYVDTAIGGQFEYRFGPTSIGSVITIKCLFCKKKEDITDYDHW